MLSMAAPTRLELGEQRLGATFGHKGPARAFDGVFFAPRRLKCNGWQGTAAPCAPSLFAERKSVMTPPINIMVPADVGHARQTRRPLSQTDSHRQQGLDGHQRLFGFGLFGTAKAVQHRCKWLQLGHQCVCGGPHNELAPGEQPQPTLMATFPYESLRGA